VTDARLKSKNVASEMNMCHVPCAQEVDLETMHKDIGEGVKEGGMKDWLESIMKKALKAPPTVSLITQDGRAELPRFLLQLAGALDGPAGEALVEESPVVIAPDVTSTAVTALASILCSGRTSSISLVDAHATKELITNLGIDLKVVSLQPRELNTVEDNRNSNRAKKDTAENEEVVEVDCERISQTQEVLTRGFRVVDVYGDLQKKVVPESNNGDQTSEDTSELMQSSTNNNKDEKKIVKKQRQSDKWERRNQREKGNRKTNLKHEVEVRKNMRLGPEPCDATHISVEENLPPLVFGKEIVPMISEPFELQKLLKAKTPKSHFKRKRERMEVVLEETLTGNHLVDDNNQNKGRATMSGDLRIVRTEIMDASEEKSGKETKRTKQKDRKGSKVKDSCKESAGEDGGGGDDRVGRAGAGGGLLRYNHCAFEGKEIVPTMFICDSCGFVGKSQYLLNNHRAYHHDTTIVHCEMCGQGFQGRLKMMMHRRRAHINAGEKQCPYCGGTFTNLWRHMKVSHTEDKDKKYKCDFCEKGFVDNSRLQAHLRSRHTGEKPFPCRYLCGKACAEAGNRKKHEITRHGREWSVDVVEANRSGDPDP